jgi:hypothetical protein
MIKMINQSFENVEPNFLMQYWKFDIEVVVANQHFQPAESVHQLVLCYVNRHCSKLEVLI